MKKILLVLTIFSFSFSGTFYVEIGQTPELTVSNLSIGGTKIPGEETYELDKGGLTIGYNHGLFQKGSWSVSGGISYTLNPVTGIRSNRALQFNAVDSESGFLSFYLLPVYQIGEKFFAWGSYGITKGLYDLTEDGFENGNTMGFGIHIKCNDTYGMGAGFTTNTLAYQLTDDVLGRIKADFEFNRMSVFFTAKIN